MKAMELERPGSTLRLVERPTPQPGPGQLLMKVAACGVRRTDLHIVDGELIKARLPIVPGHEIVGRVAQIGSGVQHFRVGDRVGVPWLGGTCGACRYCRAGRENLCDDPTFTGYQIDGGYAEYTIASADYIFPLPAAYSDAEAVPLLCAGLIGYRALKHAGEAVRLGVYGFVAAAHIVAQVAHNQQRQVLRVYAARRSASTGFCPVAGLSLGRRKRRAVGRATRCSDRVRAAWSPGAKGAPGGAQRRHRGTRRHPHERNPGHALRAATGERVIRSVANLTRRDAIEFLDLAPQVPVRTHVELFSLSDANRALARLRAGQVTGAAVLVPDG